MPSAQDTAERLREQAYRTLLPQVRDLEAELESFGASLSAGVHQLGRKLEALRHIELPTTETVLGEILQDVARQRDFEKSALVLFGRELRQKETQEEILSFLLDGAHKCFPRVALFAVRAHQLIGWSSRGYPEESAKRIGSCSFPRSQSQELEAALLGQGVTTVPGFPDAGGTMSFLHEGCQGPWHLVGLHVLERPAALLIAGGAGQDPDVVAIMADFAALHLENVACKILYELTESRPVAAAEPKPAEAAAAAAAPVAPPEAPAEPLAAEPPAVEAAEAAVEPSAAPPLPPAAPPEPPPAPAPAASEETRRSAEEEKLHSGARRFARLLVSEIKLYNEHHVLEGRKNRDIYLRLKRDIDRSREMYEKRVSPSVSRKIDYFHDEVIRILGDNDPAALGSDYPGPRAET